MILDVRRFARDRQLSPLEIRATYCLAEALLSELDVDDSHATDVFHEIQSALDKAFETGFQPGILKLKRLQGDLQVKLRHANLAKKEYEWVRDVCRRYGNVGRVKILDKTIAEC